MLNLKEYNKNKDIKKYIQKMFEVRQSSHNAHLKTKSYSQHVALNEFYDGLLALIDDFIETFQGQYGLVGDLEISVKSVEDIVEYLDEFCSSTRSARESLKETHLQNMLDEVLSLTYKTIYKLKYLS